MKRLRNTLLVLMFLAVTGLAVLLGTASGFRFLLYAADGLADTGIHVEEVSGSLARGLSLSGLEIETPTLTVRIRDLEMDMDVFPLLYGRLEITNLMLSDILAAQTGAAESQAADEVESTLPLTVNVDRLQLRRLTFRSVDQREYRINELNVALQADAATVRFARLNLYLENAAVHGKGRLDYHPELRIDSDLEWTIEADEAVPAVAGRTRIQGNLQKLELQTGFLQPLDGSMNVTVMEITDSLRWRAQLDWRPFHPRSLYESAPDLRVSGDLQAEGSLERFALKGEVVLTDIAIPDRNLETAGDSPLTLGVNINGRLDDGRYSARADLDWNALAFDLAPLGRVALPDGRLNLSLEDEKLVMQAQTPFSAGDENGRLQLDASATTTTATLKPLVVELGDTRLQVQGNINSLMDTPAVELTARWQALPLLRNAETVVHSPAGELALRGGLDDYRLTGEGQLRSPRFPDITARVTASGDRDGIRIQPLTLVLLDGQATATGTVHWAETLDVDLAWQGEELNPGQHWPDWAGNLALSGRVTMSGGEDDSYHYNVSDLDVRGQLREQPFSLRLDAGYEQGRIRLEHVELVSKEASLRAGGQLNREHSDLQWRLAVPDLGAFLSGAGGRLQGQGEFSGPPDKPSISGDLEAADVRTPWLNVDSVSADLNVDLREPGKVDVRTDVVGLEYGKQKLDELQLRVEGNNAAHDYRLTANNENSRLRLGGTGSYDDGQWQARTRTLTLTLEPFGTWQLQAPFTARVAAERSAMDKACLSRDNAALCLEGDWRDSGDWHTRLGVDNLPLNTGRPWLPRNLDVDGELDLDLTLAMQDGRSSGKGNLSLSPGHVDFHIDREETQGFEIRGGEAQAELEQGRFSAQARLVAADLAEPITADVVLTGLDDLRMLDTSKIEMQSTVRGRVDDLGFIASLTPHVIDTRGKIRVDLQGAGALADPDLTGDFQLSEAGFTIPDLGVGITRMNLHGTTTETGRYRLDGEWYSGEGIMRINARIAETEEGRLVLRADLSGEDTEIINLPEIQARATPDLKLRFSPGRQSASGDILVTSALIDLNEVRQQTPVSADVVITGDGGEEAPSEAGNLHTDLNIRFGDGIRIRGQGITGNVGGELAISNDDEGGFIGTGEVNIRDGTFSAYGQSLTIEEGRLIYHQSPLDNPEVRIRAVRQVGDITAGVRVAGYLANPVVDLFSSPSMNQEQILSYIVFGRPLSALSTGEGSDLIGAATSMGLRNSGFITSSLANTFGLDELKLETQPGTGVEEASLVIGKYLTPKLYLSYGIGLFESVNTARIRYDLSRRWAIEARQGEEMGADLLFKLEK